MKEFLFIFVVGFVSLVLLAIVAIAFRPPEEKVANESELWKTVPKYCEVYKFIDEEQKLVVYVTTRGSITTAPLLKLENGKEQNIGK